MNNLQANRTELTDSQRQMLMQRGPEAVVDRALAQQDAQTLYKAGVKKFGTDESAFLSVLSIRHENQMRATFEEYQKVNNSLLMTNLSDFVFSLLTDIIYMQSKMQTMLHVIQKSCVCWIYEVFKLCVQYMLILVSALWKGHPELNWF